MLATIDEARATLNRINHDTAERYAVVAGRLGKFLSADEFAAWSDQCIAIATSGWRSYKAADACLAVSEALAQQHGAAALLESGDFGISLAGYSHEPACEYFLGVGKLLDGDAFHQLELVQAGGELVQGRHQYASGIVSDYMKAAFALAAGPMSVELTDWIAVVRALLSPDGGADAVSGSSISREELAAFFAASREQHIPWGLVARLQAQSARAGLVYVTYYRRLAARFQPAVINRLTRLLEGNFIKGDKKHGDLESLLAAIVDAPGLTSDDLAMLVELGELTDVAELFECLVRNAGALPLANQTLLKQWYQAGLELTAGNIKAGLAYIRLESARSKEMLEGLRGQVNYADWQRVFQLFATACCGRAVHVGALSDMPFDIPSEMPPALTGSMTHDAGSFRDHAVQYIGLPATDGRDILLPPFVAIFASQADNFGFYKTSLLHQLGYFDLGCFEHIKWVASAIAACPDQSLARRLFVIIEDARIDWQLEHRYRGLRRQMSRQKQHAAAGSPRSNSLMPSRFPREQLLEAMLLIGLDAPFLHRVDDKYHQTAERLHDLMTPLRRTDATFADSMAAFQAAYEVLTGLPMAGMEETDAQAASPDNEADDQRPPPVAFRGELDLDAVTARLNIDARLALIKDVEADQTTTDEDLIELGQLADPAQLDPEQLKQGDVSKGSGLLLTELAHEVTSLEDLNPQPDSDKAAGPAPLAGIGARTSGFQTRESSTHLYDEWDHEIGDYRPRWCTLYELRELEEDAHYVSRTLNEHRVLARQVRHQLGNLRPEMLRKVKGMPEGEELDLERTITRIIDRKAGLSPDDSIYIQRQRKDRDVSTLFLLDMSASTGDIVSDAGAEATFKHRPIDEDDDDYLHDIFRQHEVAMTSARRIIDLEKESVLLMAEALEKLGDSYAVCGFSGYGKDRVDYYLCKDFDDPWDAGSRGRVGGIKPCRSTRMGPAIRHATRRLLETGARVKALIIISDGYPQDSDYGSDRNSREYGLMDTMKALTEAGQQGVLSYCLTVDPSGHDYLRAMCPDRQYMVIQDIEQLPRELSRVYRRLTG